ncbi:hypothetical protein [Pelagibacterium limicola]|uniref:hypothetical protein n=1 Tax=Pelagibacterium limicola TaxID=2791022 RepID=UPI0018AFA276|nr:hypothetical protein [Pelagibacterium limicola]
MTGAAENALKGKSLLVVREDMVLARRMCRHLEAYGANVVGPAPTVHYAQLIIGRRQLDGALFDCDQTDQDVRAFIDVLIGSGVPVLLATADGRERILQVEGAVEVMERPLQFENLVARIAAMKPVAIRPAKTQPNRADRGVGAAFSLQERFARAMVRAVRTTRLRHL